MPVIVFLNGPPGSGKDTLAAEVQKGLSGSKVVKFAKILKERTHALYGQPDLPHDHFEAVKDQPQCLFQGMSPRQAYIAVSEVYMKPMHGTGVFGNFLAHEMQLDAETKVFLISDSGFSSEAVPVLRTFGVENCLLVRIHAEGRGCTFAGDSRSYINLPVEKLDLQNNGTLEDFLFSGSRKIKEFCQQVMGGA